MRIGRTAGIALATVSLAVGIGLSTIPAAASNNGTTVNHYTTPTYTDFAGPVSCKGIHQTSKSFPGTTTSGGRDIFTCTSTTGGLTGVTCGQVITFAVNGWQSDYFYYFEGGISVLNTQAFTVTVACDASGTPISYSGVANYFP
jgi:hypothetical protein